MTSTAIRLPTTLVGVTHTVTYPVRAEHMVRALLPEVAEFRRKPQVMATGWLIAVCEWPPMQALRAHLEDAYCSLGTRVAIEHLAPVGAGATLTVTARCLHVEGRRTHWAVAARDDHEPVATGQLEFAVVHRESFEQKRLAPKQATLRAIGLSPSSNPDTNEIHEHIRNEVPA